MRSQFWRIFTFIAASAALYVGLANYTARDNFISLILLITLLFVLLFLALPFALSKEESNIQFRSMQFAAVFFRLLFLLSIPALSDDYFRFLWDGHLTNSGINPYIFSPKELLQNNQVQENQTELYDVLNSKSYNSVYPPFSQFLFAIATLISPTSIFGGILALRIMLLLADVLTIFLLPRLLSKMGIMPGLSLLYTLNPLAIIEGVGNLHFEVMVIALLVLSILYLVDKKYLLSALFLSLSAGLKLIPLILLPAISRFLGIRKAILFTITVFTFLLLTFIPFFEPGSWSIFSGLDLYMRKFEFNASVYYIIRQFGYYFRGYNIIELAGPLLFAITTSIILSITWIVKKGETNQLLTAAFFSFLIYYFFATTVHPWYIINVLFFGLLARYPLTALAWSFTVLLSYHPYGADIFYENTYLLLFEYLTVLLALFLDRKFREKYIRIGLYHFDGVDKHD